MGFCKVMRFPLGVAIWLLTLVVVAVLVLVSFSYVDLPVAEFAREFFGGLTKLGDGLGSAVLLTLEAVALLTLALLRIARGHMSPFGKVLALALISSVCAYAINSSVLKVLYGVPAPWQSLQGAPHAFNLLKGTSESSFPSGHMMLAGGFAGVFLRVYRASVLPLTLLLLFGASLLVVGGWHYVSDVVAGTFLGVLAGLLAGEVWLEHESRR